MDEIVLRAIVKWPSVPAVYGWLGLDRRGNWTIKGERIINAAVVQFIGRNYEHDDKGRWFFQNGPQRVFVKLAYTPLVYRTQCGTGVLQLVAHTNVPVQAVDRVWLDDAGSVLIHTDLGVGVIHDRDLPDLLDYLVDSAGDKLHETAIEHVLGATHLQLSPIQLLVAGAFAPVSTIAATDVPARFGFDPNPQPAQGEPEC